MSHRTGTPGCLCPKCYDYHNLLVLKVDGKWLSQAEVDVLGIGRKVDVPGPTQLARRNPEHCAKLVALDGWCHDDCVLTGTPLVPSLCWDVKVGWVPLARLADGAYTERPGTEPGPSQPQER